LTRLQRTSPSDRGLMFAAAVAALNHGHEHAALPLLEQAVRLHSQDARLWQMLGLAHRGLDQSGAAIHALTRAAELAPTDRLIMHALARTRLEAGLPSVDAFDAALALAPTDSSILLGRAAGLFADGEAAAAVRWLESLLQAHPAWIAGHQTVARLRWMSGDQKMFAGSFEAALRHRTDDGLLWRELVQVLAKAGFHEQALATIGRARAAVGSSRTLDTLEAWLVSESGDSARADQLFARLLPLDDVPAVVRYVRHLLRADRAEQAAALAEAHVGTGSNDSLWPYLALAWRMTGDRRWKWLEGDERFVGTYKVTEDAESLERLAACLRSLHLAKAQPLDQSLRGGTQTDGPLFSRLEPEIVQLRSAIMRAVRSYVDGLPQHDGKHPLLRHRRDQLRFSGSWSVRLTDGGSHANHVHSEGWISSAFYVAVPDDPSAATHDGWLTLGVADELGIRLQPIREIEPRPGRLILFPSTMWHGTRPFAKGERLTVAFDIARPEL